MMEVLEEGSHVKLESEETIQYNEKVLEYEGNEEGKIDRNEIAYYCEVRILENNSSESYDDNNVKGNQSTSTVMLKAKKHQCEVCGKMFGQKQDLTYHSVVHTGVKAFECEECGQMFGRKGNLTRHILVHTRVKDFKCEVCGKMFSQRSGLGTHLLLHSGEKKFKCGCGKCFSRKSHLVSHLIVHSVERNFKCDHCNNSFSSKSSLYKHLKNFHKNSV